MQLLELLIKKTALRVRKPFSKKDNSGDGMKKFQVPRTFSKYLTLCLDVNVKLLPQFPIIYLHWSRKINNHRDQSTRKPHRTIFQKAWGNFVVLFKVHNYWRNYDTRRNLSLSLSGSFVIFKRKSKSLLKHNTMSVQF